MLTKKTKYALQALLSLARDYGRGPVLISELAEKERIPKKFLELILLDLKNSGLLRSKKGKGGGYMLAKPPSEITFGHVIRMMDGPLAPIPCVSQMAYQRCEECRDELTCGIRFVMKEVRDASAKILDSTTLADAIHHTDRLSEREAASLMYFI
jgi:Rrf2 family protein